ncbi:thioredoxin domain-containing protein [Thioalkalivibrio sulfidiphilus]|uniref:thioredoxin domain-containing protein n=1 Tax=Thioalkalivibrio sulfidiphilus TaxID=1033854 RepID=UPI00037085C7|nr:DUF255 domain-containing protein [Thioalkalivibrio sulfidiphilus]
MNTVRPLFLALSALLSLALVALPAQAETLGMENRMAESPSPYLRLHQDDPVLWQAWEDATLELARESDRLMFVSVGYFSCHWCHVMQRESFKNEGIAARINAGFVPVKVDRELDAALDARLMNFVQVTRGFGGWPLNVVLTPDGYPLVGIVYMPPDEFDGFMERVHAHWMSDKDNLREITRQAALELAQLERARQAPVQGINVDELLDRFINASRGLADKMSGGFGNQSKFPQAAQLLALLEARQLRDEPWLDEFLTVTLDTMASQGLRDHLGGGFYRYTEDPGWQVPHFEKMLYDNALLAEVYLRAAEVFGREDYRRVALDTVHFMIDGMATGRGDYVASLSAVDDQDVEGGYYLWSPEEVRGIIGYEAWQVVQPAWGFDTTPILEHGHLPIVARSATQVAELLGMEQDRVEALLEQARSQLMEARASRVLPVDDKVVVAWNGLTLSALAAAAPHDRRAAEAGAALHARMISAMWRDGGLPRALDAAGAPVGEGELEDYAFVARGLADWAAFTGDEKVWSQASLVAERAWQLFHNDDGWRPSRQPVLPGAPRLVHLEDTPLPSTSASLKRTTARILDQVEHQGLSERSSRAPSSLTRNLVETPFVHASQILYLHGLEGVDSSPSGAN